MKLPRILDFYFRPLTRIAHALESLVKLYRLDLAERGIVEPNPGIHDEIEVLYGVKEPDKKMEYEG